MIELAPANANGLLLRTPIILAPNCATAARWADQNTLGAVATDVGVVRQARSGSSRWASTPAGIVCERLPSTPFDTLVRTERKRWARAPLPVLLALRGTPDELGEMAAQLETLEGVAGLVLLAAGQTTREAVATVRAITTLPLLPVLSHGAQISTEAGAAVKAGADALVLCRYPLAAAPLGDEIISGLLVGPALLPWTLRALLQTKKAGVPLVAWGGVAGPTSAHQCMAAGASAVMVDGALYGDPFAAQRIGAALAHLSGGLRAT